MNRRTIWCLLPLVLARPAAAQDEHPASPDTIDAEVRFGQAADADDSALAELLEAESPAPPVLELRSRLSERTEAPDGYRNGTYAGSRLKSYQRLRLAPAAHLSGGVLLEKDPGERRVNDFSTGYIALRALGPVRIIVLGDYIVESGLGLSLWRGADVGKGEDVAGAVVRKARGVVPHLSSDENAYLRGAAIGLQIGRWRLGAFSSIRRVDASVDATGAVSALYAAGYFRTPGEESKRGAVREVLFGGTLHVEADPGTAFGAGVYRSRFSRPLIFDRGRRFSGQNQDVLSFDYRWRIGPWSLFGEWGLANGVSGGSSGARVQAAAGVDLVASVRWYPYRFVSLHGNGFGESGGRSNEKGCYLGLRVSSARSWSVAAYVDVFRFPGGVPSDHFASGGSDRFLHLELRPASRCAVSLRYSRRETLEEVLTRDAAGLAVSAAGSTVRRSLRLNAEYRTAAGVRVRGRCERTVVDADPSGVEGHGMLVLAELTAPAAPKFWWNFRVALFRTTSYDARLYAYERDLEGVTTMPALTGKGFRWSCVLRYRVSRSVTCSVKYSDEVRDDVKRIGTGPDRLPGNEDGRVGLQVDIALPASAPK